VAQRVKRGEVFNATLTEMVAWSGAGLATGSRVAAVAGAGAPLATRILRWGTDLATRALSVSEERRVASTLDFMRLAIDEHLAKDEQLRDDGFFTADMDERSDAEEVFEGVMLAAQREHEERKLPYMARLFAEIAFSPSLDKIAAERLIRLAEELSYEQLVLLGLIAKSSEHQLPPDSGRGAGGRSWAAEATMADLEDLGFNRRELVGVPWPEKGMPTDHGAPASLRLRGWGDALYQAMGLDSVPFDEREACAARLRESHDGLPRADGGEGA
jgi:hypothetical protein